MVVVRDTILVVADIRGSPWPLSYPPRLTHGTHDFTILRCRVHVIDSHAPDLKAHSSPQSFDIRPSESSDCFWTNFEQSLLHGAHV